MSTSKNSIKSPSSPLGSTADVRQKPSVGLTWRALAAAGVVLVGAVGLYIAVSRSTPVRSAEPAPQREHADSRAQKAVRTDTAEVMARGARHAEPQLAAVTPPVEEWAAERPSDAEPAQVTASDPATSADSDVVSLRQRLRGVSLQLNNREQSRAVIEDALAQGGLTEEDRAALEARRERMIAKLAAYRQQVTHLQDRIQTLEEGQ